MPCWRLWRQFDIILSSFCWRVDVNLMSKFSSIFTSIFTSNVNGKNWRHQLFDQNLTWNWHQFDVTLMSFQHHFDVTNDVIDDVILTSKHWRHFDGEIFGQFWRQFSHQMLTKKIDVTSIPSPEFDLILTSDVWLL